MPSNIDPTTPAQGVPALKSDMRANWQAAHDEIEALQVRDGLWLTDYLAAGHPDGVSDDSAAFQSAMEAAMSQSKVLFVPAFANPYVITAGVAVVLTGDLFVRGVGRPTVIVSASDRAISIYNTIKTSKILSAQAEMGEHSVPLDSTVGIAVGDVLAIDSRLRGEEGWLNWVQESALVADISGSTVKLDSPLSFRHRPNAELRYDADGATSVFDYPSRYVSSSSGITVHVDAVDETANVTFSAINGDADSYGWRVTFVSPPANGSEVSIRKSDTYVGIYNPYSAEISGFAFEAGAECTSLYFSDIKAPRVTDCSYANAVTNRDDQLVFSSCVDPSVERWTSYRAYYSVIFYYCRRPVVRSLRGNTDRHTFDFSAMSSDCFAEDIRTYGCDGGVSCHHAINVSYVDVRTYGDTEWSNIRSHGGSMRRVHFDSANTLPTLATSVPWTDVGSKDDPWALKHGTADAYIQDCVLNSGGSGRYGWIAQFGQRRAHFENVHLDEISIDGTLSEPFCTELSLSRVTLDTHLHSRKACEYLFIKDSIIAAINVAEWHPTHFHMSGTIVGGVEETDGWQTWLE